MSEVITQKRFQTRFSRPYVTVSFFGPSETAGSLRDIGLALGLPTVIIERNVRKGLSGVTEGINSYSSEVYGKRILVLHEGYQVNLIASILEDLGVKVSKIK